MSRKKEWDGRPVRRMRARLKRTSDVCHICGKPIDKSLEWPDPMSFSVDHVEPQSLRPELVRSYANLAAAHLSCNSSKGNGSRREPLPTSREW